MSFKNRITTALKKAQEITEEKKRIEEQNQDVINSFETGTSSFQPSEEVSTIIEGLKVRMEELKPFFAERIKFTGRLNIVINFNNHTLYRPAFYPDKEIKIDTKGYLLKDANLLYFKLFVEKHYGNFEFHQNHRNPREMRFIIEMCHLKLKPHYNFTERFFDANSHFTVSDEREIIIESPFIREFIPLFFDYDEEIVAKNLKYITENSDLTRYLEKGFNVAFSIILGQAYFSEKESKIPFDCDQGILTENYMHAKTSIGSLRIVDMVEIARRLVEDSKGIENSIVSVNPIYTSDDNGYVSTRFIDRNIQIPATNMRVLRIHGGEEIYSCDYSIMVFFLFRISGDVPNPYGGKSRPQIIVS